MSYCDIHNKERTWIYETDEFKTYIERIKFDCYDCHIQLLKVQGYEIGRRRSR